MSSSPATQFDRSLLPPALFECVVVADTHFMIDPGPRAVEFQSRRKQARRTSAALESIVALAPQWVVHLGDLVQAFPQSPQFEADLHAAKQQWEALGLRTHVVAGNHDVGDKPDPLMPVDPASAASLETFHRAIGPSWYSFDHAGVHVVVLNSQLMNSPLSEAAVQRNWFEDDLAGHSGHRTFVFLHMPAFLWDEHEPSLGHYDNLGEPARSWLLELVRRYRVELLVAGHVHFAFCDRIGMTRYWVMPSTSFTRPGFGHLFASAPPKEQGRDDRAKLGFSLLRVFADRVSRHFIRTVDDDAHPLKPSAGALRLITATSPDFESSPLGHTLVHPLTPTAEVPIAWPSAVRQRVRNDYPLLALVELGVKQVRAPWTDLLDSFSRRRLVVLSDEGVRITASVLWEETLDPQGLLEAGSSVVDSWEFQLPGRELPDAPVFDWLRRWQKVAPCPIILTQLDARHPVPGKQHPRTRVGFKLDELIELNERLAEAGLRVDRVIGHVNAETPPWEALLALSRQPRLSRVGAVDLAFRLEETDDHAGALRAAEALFAMGLLAGSHLYFEPLIDLDRTMDVAHGLLDTRCNPRPAFHAVRCLNTILFGSAGAFRANSAAAEGYPGMQATVMPCSSARGLILEIGSTTAVLLLPEMPCQPIQLPREVGTVRDASDRWDWKLYRLVSGTSESMTWPDVRQALRTSPLEGPALVVLRR